MAIGDAGHGCSTPLGDGASALEGAAPDVCRVEEEESAAAAVRGTDATGNEVASSRRKSSVVLERRTSHESRRGRRFRQR